MRKDYFGYIYFGFRNQETNEVVWLTSINPQIISGLTLEQAEEQLNKDLKELDKYLKDGIKEGRPFEIEMVETTYNNKGLVKESKILYTKQLN